MTPIRERWCGLSRLDVLALGAGILVIALVWIVLAQSDSSILLWQDARDQTYPWWQFGARELLAGRLPLWDPYTNGGRTHVGEGTEGALYPVFWLFVTVLRGRALGAAPIHLFAFIHCVIAFVSAYALGRALSLGRLPSLCTGGVYALGGFFIDRSFQQLDIYCATSWVPLILVGPLMYRKHRQLRWPALSGAACGLSILAGHLQPAIHAGICFGLLLVYQVITEIRRSSLREGFLYGLRSGGGTLAVLLLVAAGQIAALVQYLPQAYRWVGGSEPVYGLQRLSFERIAANRTLEIGQLSTFLFDGSILRDAGTYMGLVVIALVAAGLVTRERRKAILAGSLTAFGLFLALGKQTPLLAVVYHLVPLADKVREPIRYLMIAHLGMAILGGLGLSVILRERPARWCASLMSVPIIAYLAARLGFENLSDGRWKWSCLLLIVVALVAMVISLSGRWKQEYGMGVGVLLLLAGMADLGSAWLVKVPRPDPEAGIDSIEKYYDSGSSRFLRSFLQTHPGDHRVDFSGTSIPANSGMVFGFRTTNGYGATLPGTYFNFRGSAGWFPPSRGADLLSMRYLLRRGDLFDLPVVAEDGDLRLYENSSSLPKGWLVSDVRIMERGQALSGVSAAEIDLRKTAIVEVPDRLLVEDLGQSSGTSVRPAPSTPGSDRFVVESDARALLVTTDLFYPGWKVWVDGVRSRLIVVNSSFRGVVVPAGHHEVEFAYRPLTILIGCAVGMIALLVTIVWVGAGLRGGPGLDGFH